MKELDLGERLGDRKRSPPRRLLRLLCDPLRVRLGDLMSASTCIPPVPVEALLPEPVGDSALAGGGVLGSTETVRGAGRVLRAFREGADELLDMMSLDVMG
ncbi:hypothetical protein [Caenimonas sp. SL110]|uniref:hypothetical protein n=1 Tax=Caenimonas sp. SL110 TaxID=1450524 RepID=UPI000653756D|nr:hypothetical protein [Caenimonas sp. SL110]